jgi:hypothetical protein
MSEGEITTTVLEREKRQFLRADIRWPVTVFTSDVKVVGETKDISQVGVSISCRALPPLGQEFRLEIQPPNREPLVVTAKAVWVKETTSREISCRFILGVEFEYISEDDITFLGNAVSSELQDKFSTWLKGN